MLKANTMEKKIDLRAILTMDTAYTGVGTPMSPPLYQTSIFTFPTVESFQKAGSDEANNAIYTRGNNPTVQEVERKIAALEGAEKAKLVSSGVSAIAAGIMGFVKQGDHIVCTDDCYGWARYICQTYLSRFGVESTLIDGCCFDELKSAVKPNTKLFFLESPGSLTFRILSLKKLADFSRSLGIKTVIDNTWATPLNQNPLKYGIDLVVHSATKYLGGHSDVLGGIIAGSKKDIEHIFKTEFMPIGTVPDPFQAWLILRGMRTLRIRLAEHYKSAMKIADFLYNHRAVEKIYYPFHPSHEQYDLAREQMSGGNGLLSFRPVNQDEKKINTMVNALEYFHIAVSWGGYDSLALPIRISGRDEGMMVRIHIGLEEAELLIEDLNQALSFLI